MRAVSPLRTHHAPSLHAAQVHGHSQPAMPSQHGPVVPCLYCGAMALRSHQFKCPKRPVLCKQCGEEFSAAAIGPHAEVCGAAEMGCPGCQQIIVRSRLREHVARECEARSFTCADCGEAFWIAEEYLQHALPRCKSGVVSCQLCGALVQGSQLAHHYVMCAQRNIRHHSSVVGSASGPPSERASHASSMLTSRRSSAAAGHAAATDGQPPRTSPLRARGGVPEAPEPVRLRTPERSDTPVRSTPLRQAARSTSSDRSPLDGFGANEAAPAANASILDHGDFKLSHRSYQPPTSVYTDPQRQSIGGTPRAATPLSMHHPQHSSTRRSPARRSVSPHSTLSMTPRQLLQEALSTQLLPRMPSPTSSHASYGAGSGGGIPGLRGGSCVPAAHPLPSRAMTPSRARHAPSTLRHHTQPLLNAPSETALRGDPRFARMPAREQQMLLKDYRLKHTSERLRRGERHRLLHQREEAVVANHEAYMNLYFAASTSSGGARRSATPPSTQQGGRAFKLY